MRREGLVPPEAGDTHPGPEQEASQQLLRIATDKTVQGYCVGTSPEAIGSIVAPAIVGQEPSGP